MEFLAILSEFDKIFGTFMGFSGILLKIVLQSSRDSSPIDGISWTLMGFSGIFWDSFEDYS